jgi:hypothetical protein
VVLLLPILAFLFVTLLIAAAAMALAPANGGVIQRRLGELRGVAVDEPSPYNEAGKRSRYSSACALAAACSRLA